MTFEEKLQQHYDKVTRLEVSIGEIDNKMLRLVDARRSLTKKRKKVRKHIKRMEEQRERSLHTETN